MAKPLMICAVSGLPKIRKKMPTPISPRLATETPITAPPLNATQQGRALPRVLGRGRGAHVGLGGRLHPQEAGQHGAGGAAEEGHGGLPTQESPEQDGHDHDKDRQDRVLAPEEGHRAGVDRGRDLLHQIGAGGALDDPPINETGEKEAEQPYVRAVRENIFHDANRSY